MRGSNGQARLAQLISELEIMPSIFTTERRHVAIPAAKENSIIYKRLLSSSLNALPLRVNPSPEGSIL